MGIPVDRVKPKSSSRLQRERNLEADPRAALLVEHWDRGDWSRLWWVRAELRWQGNAAAARAADLAARLARAYPQYRDQPFTQVLVPTRRRRDRMGRRRPVILGRRRRRRAGHGSIGLVPAGGRLLGVAGPGSGPVAVAATANRSGCSRGGRCARSSSAYSPIVPATGVRRSPALAEEIGLLARQPGPGGNLSCEDLGVSLAVGPGGRQVVPEQRGRHGGPSRHRQAAGRWHGRRRCSAPSLTHGVRSSTD